MQLLAVVSELERQGLIVLVLGRKHMLQPSRSWDRHNMKLIQEKAHCFFTDNMWAPVNNEEQCDVHFTENSDTHLHSGKTLEPKTEQQQEKR